MSYSFSSEPRAVRSKYRPEDESSVTNIHSDPRVARGSTYATETLSAQSQPKRKRRVKRKDIFAIPPETQKSIPVPLDQYLIEQKEIIPSKDASDQTDTLLPRPPTLNYYTKTIPKKSGIDVSTQIELEDQLFDFESEVEPLLNVLIGKTLELSLMEVEEEAELAAIKEDKERYMAARREEAEEIKKLEQQAVQTYLQKEQTKRAQAERVQLEFDVSSKVAASAMTRLLCMQSKDSAFDQLQADGEFYDPDLKGVEESLMPWIYQKADQKRQQQKLADQLANEMLRNAMKREQLYHDAWWLQQQATRHRQMVFEPDPPEDPLPEGYIRIFIKGSSLQGLLSGATLATPEAESKTSTEEMLADDGTPLEMIGPIPVAANEALEVTELKVQEWIQQHVNGDFTPPEGGYLKFAYAGQEIKRVATLFDAAIPDEANLEVSVGEIGKDDLLDDEGDDNANADTEVGDAAAAGAPAQAQEGAAGGDRPATVPGDATTSSEAQGGAIADKEKGDVAA